MLFRAKTCSSENFELNYTELNNKPLFARFIGCDDIILIYFRFVIYPKRNFSLQSFYLSIKSRACENLLNLMYNLHI